uniref:IPT/TIG domain-containing protein n=1 Tax=Hanusia phi TaxID=3032 RepID=A0A7S0HJB5_9CRYP|mmetsp:Transcript_21399/g.48413  ORF Transcript_21399/g.48413 Transcript_21399/m.48413 type:complete len:1167 (+) Transcript_21399:130-3630(+)
MYNHMNKIVLGVLGVLIVGIPGCSSSSNDLYGLTSRWEKLATNSKEALTRNGFGIMQLNDQIAIFGGLQGPTASATYLNDLWELRADGEFHQVDCCGWSRRMNFAYTLHTVNGTPILFLIGGYYFTGNVASFYNDVWSTSDFVQFSFVKRSTSGYLPPCSLCVAVSYQGNIFLLGGCNSLDNSCGTAQKQIYFSPDGTSWQKAITDSDAEILWKEKSSTKFMAAVSGGKLIVVIGSQATDSKDVWSLSWNDGTKTLSIGTGAIGNIPNEEGGGKFSAVLLSLFSNLWLLTGASGSTITDYISYSADGGVNWAGSILDQQQQNIFKRQRAAGTVWQQRICVLGGILSSDLPAADMWCSVPPKFPSPTFYSNQQLLQAATWYPSPLTVSIQTGRVPTESCAEIRYDVAAQAAAPSSLQQTVSLSSPSFTLDLAGGSSQTKYIFAQVVFPCSKGFTNSDIYPFAVNLMQQLRQPSSSSSGVFSVKGIEVAMVQLACQGDVAGASVRYTYGSEATEQTSPSPVSLVLVDGSSSVKAKCIASHWVDSSEIQFSFIVNREAAQGPKSTTSSSSTTSRASSPMDSTPIPSSPQQPPPQVSSFNFCCQLFCQSSCETPTSSAGCVSLLGSNLNRVEGVEVSSRSCVSKEASETRVLCCFDLRLGEEAVTIRWSDLEQPKSAVVGNVRFYPALVAVLAFSPGIPCSGSTISISGSNFGALLAGQQFSESSSSFLGHKVRGIVGHTTATQVEWVSDSSVLVMAPPGAGANLKVQLLVDGVDLMEQASVSQRFSYLPPAITSIKPSLGAAEGSMLVTIMGRNFGCSADALTVQLGSQPCKMGSLKINELICSSPPRSQNLSQSIVVDATVLLANQAATSVRAYQYVAASQAVTIYFISLSNEQVTTFIKFLWSRLNAISIDQFYVVPSTRRSSPSLTLRILSTSLSSMEYEMLMRNLITTANSPGGFADSGLQVTGLLLPSGERINLLASATGPTSTPAAAQGSSSLPSSQIAVIVCCVVVVVSGFLYLAPRFRRRISSRVPPPLFSPNIVFSQSELADELPSIRVVSSGTTGWIFEEEGTGFGCEQCRRSGFRVCIHQTMKSVFENVSPPSRYDDDDDEANDELCIVCLDRPRDVIIVHGNEEKTLHKVTCSECTQRIREAGGTCPMCRQPIFDVL